MRCVFLLALAAMDPLAAQDLRIGVDPRVELFSILFRLAGSPEYNSGTIASYNQATDRYFAAFRGHDAVLLAREMRLRYGVGHDAVVSLAVHTDGVPELNERVALDWPGRALDTRWQPAVARQFLEAARRFAVEANFLAFLEEQNVLVNTAGERMRRLVDESVDLEWFPKFYGKAPGAALSIVPGLTTGTSSYGPRFVGMDGTEELFAIIGIFSLDGDGLPVFPSGISSTIVHEFSHSFVNPSVDRIMAEARASAEAVLRQVAEPMRAQGYGNGQALLYESVVRAASARYSLAHGGPAVGLDAVRYEQGRSFYWTERLYGLLGEYEADREAYPDLNAFLPRILVFFLGLPEELPGIIEAFHAARPRVVSSVPRPNEGGVDPGLTRIEVRFDRPMRNSWSVSRVAGKNFPQAVRAYYDEERLVFTLEVKLEAETSYTLSFNSEGGGNFMTEDRMRIDPYLLAFSTR